MTKCRVFFAGICFGCGAMALFGLIISASLLELWWLAILDIIAMGLMLIEANPVFVESEKK